MDRITIIANDTEHTVETKPLTLICHQDNVKIAVKDDDIIEISPETTIKVADGLVQSGWEELRKTDYFLELWHCVFPDDEPPLQLVGESLAYRHIVGMIILLWFAGTQGKRPFVRFPETYLHPKSQLGLADLFITIGMVK